MHRRKFSMFKFVGVFTATLLIFLLGILLGNYLNSLKVTHIDSLQNDLRMDTLALETQSLILSKNPCEVSELTVMSDELYEIGEKLTFMESQLGANHESVKRLKNYYSLIELRHWILLTEANQKCGLGHKLILYFYSNELGCSDCEKQGFVLDHIRKIRSDVKIYSFEYGLDNAAFNTIKNLFKVKSSELPVIVINNEKYTGFKDITELESLLDLL